MSSWVTTPTGLKAQVIKVHDVRVGDRLYVTCSGVANDVRTVTEITRGARHFEYRFDRGPALRDVELQHRYHGRGDGTVWLLDPEVVAELPDLLALASPLERWIEGGGAAGVDHTPRQYEWPAQMLTEMRDEDGPGPDVYRCYAIDPRSLLIDRLPGSGFDDEDPRPQMLIWSRMWLPRATAWWLIREAMGLEEPGSWVDSLRQVADAAVEIGIGVPDAPVLAVVRPAVGVAPGAVR